jgi:hypothetical protein
MSSAGGGTATSRRALVALLAACALGAFAVGAQARADREPDEEPKEYKVKAYFLAHFIGYTTWPKTAFEKADSPFVLLVVGEDPFGEQLELSMQKVRVAGHAVRVERRGDLEDLPRAHLVFVARSHAGELGKLLALPQAATTLLVGDAEGLAADGAHVGFYLEGKQTRFEVNEEAVKRSQLTISSEMLKLARLVKDRKRREAPEEREP